MHINLSHSKIFSTKISLHCKVWKTVSLWMSLKNLHFLLSAMVLLSAPISHLLNITPNTFLILYLKKKSFQFLFIRNSVDMTFLEKGSWISTPRLSWGSYIMEVGCLFTVQTFRTHLSPRQNHSLGKGPEIWIFNMLPCWFLCRVNIQNKYSGTPGLLLICKEHLICSQ